MASESDSRTGRDLDSDVITRRVIRPNDCALVFGIQTSYEGFALAKASPENRDFVPGRCRSWQRFSSGIVHHVETVVPRIEELGASVVFNATVDRFRDVFADNFPVVVLFSHWKGGAVEFAEGLVPSERIVEAIPSTYAGIIDLSVCRPEPLAIGIKQKRPGCVVRYIKRSASPGLWLYFFLGLLTVISEGNTTYLQAVERVQDTFLRGLSKS